jgi:hypothetical protein
VTKFCVDEITSSSSEQRAKYLFSLKIPKEFPELLGDLEPRPTCWDPNWLASKYLLPGLPNFKLRNVTGLDMNIAGTASLFPFLHYDDLWTEDVYHSSVRAKRLGILSPGSDPLYVLFGLEQGKCSTGRRARATTRSLTPSIAVVLSTANGPIMRAWQSPKWNAKFAAVPISVYLTAFRAVKSVTDPF